MTHPDILTLIDAIVKNRMRFSMLSNGTLFNQENARHIKKTGRCDNIQVSIDGSCPEVHDKIRGKGAFVRAVRGIKILQEAGLKVSVRVTINRVNLTDLPNTFKLLFEDLKVKSVGTNESFPRGSAHCNIKDLDMTPEERREAERICLEYAEKYPSISAAAGPLAIGRKLKEIKEYIKNPPKEKPRRGGFLRACNIASQKLSILHDGKIVPCTQLPHMVLGQIGVDPIEKVWHESVGLEYLRTRHRIPLGQLEECRDCKYQQYCTGGCPAVGYAVTGKMTGRNPRDCYRALLGEDPEYAF
jgi:SynChlorMet cassette radical SAM/SPASM protein ScmE